MLKKGLKEVLEIINLVRVKNNSKGTALFSLSAVEMADIRCRM
jgi:hypothetical protein